MSILVETQAGKLEGVRRGSHLAFLGIPYAKPPVGPLRFKAPLAPEPWAGVRSAATFGPSALQGAVFAPGVRAEGKTGEDCLYLNVFTPAADDEKRPVLFWIHGGAFTVGWSATPLYDGKRLAEEHDVVVVTINYRLGALGYLALGEQAKRWGAVENRGQHDQIAALQWVRANIERFGGDPDNVTIFGESAGGTAVCLLLATPSARGLFARAIAQSSVAPLALAKPEQRAHVTDKLLRALDLSPALSERLNDVPAEALMKAQAVAEADLRSWPHFFPVLDGDLYPDEPGALLTSGRGSSVPLVIGSNRDEWNLFAIASLVQDGEPLSDADVTARLTRVLPSGFTDRAPALIATYRASRSARALPHGNRALLRAIEGDLYFGMPTVRFAELYQALQPSTYAYLFSYESPAMRGVLGACHALELPFVFGTYDSPEQERFVGTGEVVAALSRTMREAWTSFARSGAPVAQPCGSWPAYDLTRRAVVELSAEPRVIDDPYPTERRAWEGMLETASAPVERPLTHG